jgi:hypothetical protein
MFGSLRRHGGRVGLAALLCVLATATPSSAMVRVPAHPAAVSKNPADALADVAIEGSKYDPATRCSKASRPGMTAFVTWLSRNARGANWGTYRCEKWGKREASLHAEGRALDWHLDVGNPEDRREARRIIELLLAPDLQGNEHALARRMGVEELIWDCGYWGAGMDEFSTYRPCANKHGKLRKRVNPTVAHRDHLHIGLSRRGAAAKTSFWTKASFEN